MTINLSPPPVGGEVTGKDKQFTVAWKMWLNSLFYNVVNNTGGGSGTGTVTHATGVLINNQIVIGNGGGDVKPLGSLGTSSTVLHGNASGAPTFSAVSLATDVTGNLPVSNLNGGISASNSTFWRGDGTWALSGSITEIDGGLPDSTYGGISPINGGSP